MLYHLSSILLQYIFLLSYNRLRKYINVNTHLKHDYVYSIYNVNITNINYLRYFLLLISYNH